MVTNNTRKQIRQGLAAAMLLSVFTVNGNAGHNSWNGAAANHPNNASHTQASRTPVNRPPAAPVAGTRTPVNRPPFTPTTATRRPPTTA